MAPLTAPPCTPWATVADVWDCCPTEDVTASGAAVYEDVLVAATELLYALSGGRFNGGCEVTLRPCTQGCSCWFPSGWGYGVAGIGWDGWAWGWNGQVCDHCGCGSLEQVELVGPIRVVSEVKVDGVILDPAAYRVDEYRWLVRLDGGAWPACQNLALDDTEVGTWSVTYTYGVDVPMLGRMAAAQLACNLFSACGGGGDCALPPGVTRYTRQGVTVERSAFLAFAYDAATGAWATGMPLVDAFLAAWGARRRSFVWTPAMHPIGRRVGT